MTFSLFLKNGTRIIFSFERERKNGKVCPGYVFEKNKSAGKITFEKKFKKLASIMHYEI